MSDFYTELDNPSLGLGYAAGMVLGAIAGALLYKLVSRKGRQLETKVAMEENTFREATTSGISQVQEDPREVQNVNRSLTGVSKRPSKPWLLE